MQGISTTKMISCHADINYLLYDKKKKKTCMKIRSNYSFTLKRKINNEKNVILENSYLLGTIQFFFHFTSNESKFTGFILIIYTHSLV